MRVIARLLLLLSMTAALTCSAETQKFSPAEQELINIVKSRIDAAATRDLTAWSRYVAEDCIFSGDDGSVGTKAKMLAYYNKVPAEYDHAIDSRDFRVRLYGDTAIVNLRATDHEPSGGVDLIGEQRRTETFIKRDGVWLAVAIQWSAIPVNHRKPVPFEGKSYQDYVGQYQDPTRPKDDVETLSINDGRLWSQVGDEGDWCVPAGRDKFFYQSDLGTFTFSRDAQGHVTGYTYQRFDGQEFPVKKIK